LLLFVTTHGQFLPWSVHSPLNRKGCRIPPAARVVP
jgi:hypothetical protein